MLLPLTSAVYVSGKLASYDSILLEIGTGYYAEVTILLSFVCPLNSKQVLKKRKILHPLTWLLIAEVARRRCRLLQT